MSNNKGLTARSAWIAGIAGLGWLLSGVLNGWLIARPSILPVSFVELLFPETIALNTWRTVDIWPVFIAVLSTLALMLLTAAALMFIGQPDPQDPAHQRIRFFAAWMCVAIAAFATTVLSAAGEILASWPPPRVAWLFQGVEQDLLSAGYWGIFWGWVPVLAGAFFAKKRPSGIRQRASFKVPGLLVAVPAVLVAGALVVAIPQAERDTKAQTAVATSVLAPPAAPEAAPIGSPDVSYAAQDTGKNWCDGKDVAISLSVPDAATGHRGMGFTLTNNGAAPCVLDSYPDVAFDNTAGWAIDVMVVNGGSFMTDDPGVKPVTVAPGQSAQASMGWNAMAGAGDIRVGNMLVAPYAGTLRHGSKVDLDIVDGGTVSVTAWEKAVEVPESSPYPRPGN